MTRRQSVPEQWFILQLALSEDAVRSMPSGSGVLVLGSLTGKERQRLRMIARHRQLTLVFEERRKAARVHNQRELTGALLGRAPLILISPVHPTTSHPDWHPIPRMRAAALARLAGRRAIALGGMNAKRYAKIAQLGFIAWAGISAFRT